MSFRFTRDFYVPSGAVKVADKASSACAYFAENVSGGFHLVTFGGRRQKPDANVLVRSRARLEGVVKRHFENVRAKEAARKASRVIAPHRFEVGQIFCCSWGYDQTRVDFYEVIARTEKTVTVRPIAKRDHADDQARDFSWRVMPVPRKFTGEAKRCVVRDGRIRVSSYSSASPWNGEPKTESGYH